MDALVLALNVVALLCGVALAFVAYHLMRALFAYLDLMLDDQAQGFLLFRLPEKVLSALFAACFLALVL